MNALATTSTKMLSSIKINQQILSKSADMNVKNNSVLFSDTIDQFSKMNITELNKYINDIYKGQLKTSKSNSTNVVDPITDLKLAWLAAAQIAKLNGYPCAAKAVEYSVLGIDYTEDNGSSGLFASKILNSSAYRNNIGYIRRNGLTYSNEVIEFTKSDNSDLFYALHNVTMTVNKVSNDYPVEIFDIFDFAYDNNYDSLFTSLVNNWAWLCQNTFVLNDIYINIYFNGK